MLTNCLELVERLGLGDFDLLLVADGSGTTADRPCGWHCVAYTPWSHRVVEHSGGATGGTNNYAELMPFVHALWAFHAERVCRGHDLSLRVLVELISDSEVTVRCGNGRYGRNANQALWAAIDWFAHNGYRLHWNHVPRNSNPVNARADRAAGGVRRLLEGWKR